MAKRLIWNLRKYTFVTPSQLRRGQRALDMHSGTSYLISEYQPKNEHPLEGLLSRGTFLRRLPWEYSGFTHEDGVWFPQMLKIGDKYAWTNNPECGDCVTDGNGNHMVVVRRTKYALVLRSGNMVLYHHWHVGGPMLMQKIPIPDGY